MRQDPSHVTSHGSSHAAPPPLEASPGAARARFVVADLFTWQPDAEYDTVVFTFWLSHVPPERFAEFWALVARCLKPGGRVFFLDSLGPESTAFDHRRLRQGDIQVTRELNDGRSFRIYKVFYHPEDLEQRLRDLGWQANVRNTSHYFIFGEASRSY
jgi:demethylmenaquinone methyltransferase/2-methoxy-6-polyprenyl-1,4-benzoquinol methylase